MKTAGIIHFSFTNPSKHIIYFLPLLAILLSGCSLKSMALKTTADIMVDGISAFEEENDIQFAREAIPANLKLLEALYKGDEENYILAETISKTYFAYSFAILEQDYWDLKFKDPKLARHQKNRATNFYKRGRDYALRILEGKEGFKESLFGDLTLLEESLKKFEEDDVPALFWLAFNWAQFINLSKDKPAEVIHLARVKLLMNRVMELNDRFYFGSVHIFFGSFYASRPEMLGGNPKKGKEHFEKAIEISDGKFLLGKVFYAWFYAIQAQNIELYDRLLKEVLDASDVILPGQELITSISKRVAKRLSAQREEYFDIEGDDDDE